MSAYSISVREPISLKGYARTLYENYRARMLSAGQNIPTWAKASASVKKEFVCEARQLLM